MRTCYLCASGTTRCIWISSKVMCGEEYAVTDSENMRLTMRLAKAGSEREKCVANNEYGRRRGCKCGSREMGSRADAQYRVDEPSSFSDTAFA